jgi:hypothetical protein
VEERMRMIKAEEELKSREVVLRLKAREEVEARGRRDAEAR